MSATPPPVLPAYKAPNTGKVLRRLFLTVFLRGHTSRGIAKDTAPKSIVQKLGLVLFIYALMGIFAVFTAGQPVINLSILLHFLTFVMLAMFITGAAGETLFNKEEADILLHRPISPKTLLWSKISVLILVSFYLAFAINLAGFVVGPFASNGSWLFPIVHAVSMAEEALFCAGCVVLLYQVCLRWIGRERLDSVMTTLQVLFTMGFFLATQIVPRMFLNSTFRGAKIVIPTWVKLLPPTWFAALDDGLAGSRSHSSIMLSLVGLGATGLVAWLAFGKLANVYVSGAQNMNEAAAPRMGERRQGRVLQKLASLPPLNWALRGSVDRASFLLLGAYLFRDRDIKLRLYPGIAPLMMLPFISLVTQSQTPRGVGFDISPFMFSLSGAYIGFIPLYTSVILRYSQQWRASEVFRLAPIVGPWPIQRGAQWALCTLFATPAFLLTAILATALQGPKTILLLVPGLISLPFFAMINALIDPELPLSLPSEEAKAAGRGCTVSLMMMFPVAFAGAAMAAWVLGFFTIFLAIEVAIVFLICFLISQNLRRRVWRPLE